MILFIDNYDSFVHNLARYFQRLGQTTQVIRNDAATVEQLRALRPAALVISPGPCTPQEAGCSLEVVRAFTGQVPVLGVCLGHQTIAAALGGQIVRAKEPMHGRTSPIVHDGQGIFAGIPNPVTVCRYHSLVVQEATLPSELRVIARAADGTIMGIQHRAAPVVGWQFHPESILTEYGYRMLANFLQLAGVARSADTTPGGELAAPPTATPLPSQPVTF